MSNRPSLFTGPFLRLLAFVFITFTSAFQLFPTMPLRIIELGGSKAAAGLFLAVYTWASAIAAPLTGTVADNFGRRRLMLTASIAFLLFTLLYAMTTSLPVLLAIGLVHGVLWSGLLSASGAMLTSIIPSTRRVEGLGYYGMAPTLAIAFAPLLGLHLFKTAGWVAVCTSMAVLSVLILLLGLRITDSHQPVRKWPRPRQLVDWRVVLVGTTLLVCAFAYGGLTSYVAIFTAERGIHPDALFFVVLAIAIIVTRIVITPLGDRYGPLWLLYPALLLVPPALLLLIHAETGLQIALSATLFGIGFGAIYPALLSAILMLVPGDRHGATFGSILMSLDIGIGAGSLVIGWIAGTRGWSAAWGTAAAVAALAIPIFLLTYPRFARSAETN